MYPFFESIKVSEGIVFLWEQHLQRMNNTLLHHGASSLNKVLLERTLKGIPHQGLYKLRLLYNADSAFTIEYIPYQKKRITHLTLIQDDDIVYDYKYTDRSGILKHISPDRPSEEIIFIKKGLVTDTSYANLAFYDGKHWITPLQPLLDGIKRKHLLSQGLLTEKNIKVEDLAGFQQVSLINAMLDLGELTIETARIKKHLI